MKQEKQSTDIRGCGDAPNTAECPECGCPVTVKEPGGSCPRCNTRLPSPCETCSGCSLFSLFKR